MSHDLRSLIRRPVLIAAAAAALTPLPARAQVAAAEPVVRDAAAELACGARAATTAPAATIRLGPGRDPGQRLFGPGDPLIVHAGAAQGLRPGQEYFVRRVIPDRFTHPASDGVPTLSIHTAGWVKIVEVHGDSAIATVTRACDAMQEGDYLEPFEMPPLPDSTTFSGEPDYAHPGHLILGDDRRQMGSSGSLMVLDRGSDHGIHAGQHVTVFRRPERGTGPSVRIGEATAMVVHPETTILRIDKTMDAVVVGDLVAIHR
jgi:hypothetical protein